MKTKLTITKLEGRDLSLLLGAAAAGSEWLAITTNKDARGGFKVDGSVDLAASWAAHLLAGGKLTAFDSQAEGELRGPIKDKHLDEDGDGVYIFGLDDIIRGLEAAANATYTGALERGKDPGSSSFSSLYFRDISAFSGPEADVLLQIILFNEIVY